MYSSLKGKSIFIIHSERDINIINQLESFFSQQCYYNSQDNDLTDFMVEYIDSSIGNYVGQVYSDLIKEKFDECHYYLIILTRNSENRVWVNQEIGYALAKDDKRILIMVEDKIKDHRFGFIHSNYFVQYFTYDGFKISETGDEIDKIDNTIISMFGDRIPKSKIIPPTDEIKTIVQEFNSLIKKGEKDD